MNDDDRTQLASAYLDDEATLDQRVLAEGDPEVLAEVDRLRAVRALLAAAEPAPISVRERHLATALDAWDRIPDAERTGLLRDATPRGVDGAAAAGAATVSAPPRLSDRRRGLSTKWLTAAAAALVVVLAGGLALQLDTGDDDSDASTAADTASEATLGAAAAAPAGDAGTDEARDATSSAEAGDSAFAQEELEADAATDGGQLDTGIDDAAPPADTGLIVLLTPDDLALFAADAVAAPPSPDGPAATSAPVDLDDLSAGERAVVEATTPVCLGVDVVVGPAVYGEVVVVVGIDEGRDLAIAYTAIDCREVARARMP